MTHTTRARKRRTASAIGVLVAVIGLTAGTAVTASATADAAKKCFAEAYYEGKWIKVEVACG
ncbi:hypothetical protein ACIQKE_31585 [Streptomyces griseoviridis]|uniref:Uncharacterized protein n=1 Tax=Streptomyces hintoniae TaxID=3075521 RepID=A0ABU2UKI2_9ACTN|nr:hypothetical protein [Streptomyces sp. DSM 41014]MDT0473766.1 hypothetical protein [Streptomyces sp. DSM 41014]